MPQNKIPISVIVVTKNEASRIARTLDVLQMFEDLWVVDSESAEGTQRIAAQAGAQVVDYKWDGRYPKKRQWALENLPLKYERIFFVDADEIITPELSAEIAALDWRAAGYFIKGLYVVEGQILRHGLQNNKLCLFDRTKIEFPAVDDLDLEGMGEIEGHYQPVFKAGFESERLGQLRAPMIHEALADSAAWEARHVRYARWEAGMNAKGAWPSDPKCWRQFLKTMFRALPFRDAIAFMQSYIFALGFLDGRKGFEFARLRARYYRMIRDFKAQ